MERSSNRTRTDSVAADSLRTEFFGHRAGECHYSTFGSCIHGSSVATTVAGSQWREVYDRTTLRHHRNYLTGTKEYGTHIDIHQEIIPVFILFGDFLTAYDSAYYIYQYIYLVTKSFVALCKKILHRSSFRHITLNSDCFTTHVFNQCQCFLCIGFIIKIVQTNFSAFCG